MQFERCADFGIHRTSGDLTLEIRKMAIDLLGVVMISSIFWRLVKWIYFLPTCTRQFLIPTLFPEYHHFWNRGNTYCVKFIQRIVRIGAWVRIASGGVNICTIFRPLVRLDRISIVRLHVSDMSVFTSESDNPTMSLKPTWICMQRCTCERTETFFTASDNPQSDLLYLTLSH